MSSAAEITGFTVGSQAGDKIHTDLITRMLLGNRGTSFLPEFVVRDCLKKNQLAVLDVDCPEIEMWGQLVYHRNKWLTPQMERFMELLADCREKNG